MDPQSPFDITREELVSLMETRTTEHLVSTAGGIVELANVLCTDLRDGLPIPSRAQEQQLRQAHFGANIHREPPMHSLLYYIWEALKDTTLIILIVAAMVSLVFGLAFFPLQDLEWLDSIGIGVAVVLVVTITAGNDWSKERKFRQLNRVKEDRMVKAVRDGHVGQVSVHDVIVGDVLFLEAGDEIPADGVMVPSTITVRVDESALTGESDSVKHNASSPFLLAGSHIVDGSCNMLTLAVGESSEWGQTLATVAGEQVEETPLQKKLGTLAKLIGYVGITVATTNFVALTAKYLVMTFVIGGEAAEQFSLGSLLDNLLNYFIVAVTIVVVAVPEGLPLAVTISLAYSMKKMLRDNNLVRHLSACETMGSSTTICSDKTGTLTTNRMQVVEGWFSGTIFGKVPMEEELHPDVFNVLCDGIAINSTAHVSGVGQLGRSGGKDISDDDAIYYGNIDTDPQEPVSSTVLNVEFIGNKTECAMLYMLIKHFDIDYATIRRDAEPDLSMVYTFNSDRKRMSTVVQFEVENQFRIFTKGAPEIVLEHCTKAMNSEGEIVALDDTMREDLLTVVDDMASRGLRTICLAFNDFQLQPSPQTPSSPLISMSEKKNATNSGNGDAAKKPITELDPENAPEQELIAVAILGIKDPLREGASRAVEKCKNAGITVRMVTGDNYLTAQHIARECGILPQSGSNEGMLLSGEEFRRYTDEDLLELLPNLRVLARSRPSDKHRLVTLLKNMGEIVAVTGDGTNDAPALKAAHVGLSMGLSGSEVAKEASDVVIMDDNFGSIVKSVLWGRTVFGNIRKFLQFQLTINIVALVVTFVGSIMGAGFPLTAVQLLWVNLIMDTLAALALASEPPSEELLERPPHDPESSLINYDMWKCMIVQAVVQLVVCFSLLYGHEHLFGPLAVDNPWSRKSSPDDYTLIFNTFVMMQLFNEVNCRKIANEFNILHQITQSPLFLSIMLCTVVMQVVIVEVGRFIGPQYMGTNGLTAMEWLFSIAVGSLSIPVGYLCRVIPVSQSDKAKRRTESGRGLTTDIELEEGHHGAHPPHASDQSSFVQLVEDDDMHMTADQ